MATLPICETLIAGKLDQVEGNVAVAYDDASHHQFGYAALFF